ncbi:MAG: hypothetical protein ACK54Z_04370 [Cyanobacteriota bacterium]|jgi:hypothetical protein
MLPFFLRRFPKLLLKDFYFLFLFLAFSACMYVLVKPGISKPFHPTLKLKDTEALRFHHGSKLVSSESINLNKDTSDRKLSRLETYDFSDGSQLLSLMVRVRKEGDFKIEGYGLLTKNIDQIYMENSTFSNAIPYSMIGILNNKKAYQTCIVPSSTNINQVDVRLAPLTSMVKKSSQSDANRFLLKLFGLERMQDYSCLVLTYIPPANSNDDTNAKLWASLVQYLQGSIDK